MRERTWNVGFQVNTWKHSIANIADTTVRDHLTNAIVNCRDFNGKPAHLFKIFRYLISFFPTRILFISLNKSQIQAPVHRTTLMKVAVIQSLNSS